jgi:prefoldin subunit 5
MTTSNWELQELEQIVNELRRRIQVLESRLITVEQQQGPIMKAAARFRAI